MSFRKETKEDKPFSVYDFDNGWESLVPKARFHSLDLDKEVYGIRVSYSKAAENNKMLRTNIMIDTFILERMGWKLRDRVKVSVSNSNNKVMFLIEKVPNGTPAYTLSQHCKQAKVTLTYDPFVPRTETEKRSHFVYFKISKGKLLVDTSRPLAC